jgi:predicted membrane channel-forming protein YqfA (hemolysin III family)
MFSIGVPGSVLVIVGGGSTPWERSSTRRSGRTRFRSPWASTEIFHALVVAAAASQFVAVSLVVV